MSNEAGLISVKKFVKNIQLSVGDNGNKYTLQFLAWMQMEICKLEANHLLEEAKTVMLPITPMGTVDLPTDLIKLTKVGVCCNGRIVTLGVCDDLCVDDLDKQRECGCSSKEEVIDHVVESLGITGTYSVINNGEAVDYLPPADFESQVPCPTEEAVSPKKVICRCGCSSGSSHCCSCYNNIRYGSESLGERYGVGRGYDYIGMYKWDKPNCRIILDPLCNRLPAGSLLAVEYFGAAENTKYIPKYMIEALEHKMYYYYYTFIKSDNSKARFSLNRYITLKSYSWPQHQHHYTAKDLVNVFYKFEIYGIK